MSNNIHRQLSPAILITLTVALACLVLVLALSSSLATLPKLTSAQLEDGQESGASSLSLPYFWSSYRTGVSERVFEIDFDVEEAAIDAQDLYFFMPFFEQSLAMSVNGTKLGSRDLDQPHYNPLAYYNALVRVPPEVLSDADNKIVLIVNSGLSPLGAVSPIYYGSFEQLRGPYGYFSFFTFQLRIGVMGAELILAIFCLLTALRRPKEPYFGWLSAVLFGSTLSSLSNFSVYFPVLDGLFRFSYMLLPTVGIATLGLGFSLAGIKIPRGLFYMFFAIPFVILVLLEYSILPSTAVLFLYSVGILILSMIVASFFILRATLASYMNESSLLFIVTLTPALAIAYDALVRLGVVTNGVPISVLARILVLSAAIIYLLQRATVNAEIVGKAAITLRQRLDAREKELVELFSAQRGQLERIAKSDERQRITAELHDGVAGHLVTILALSDTQQSSSEPIRAVTRTALDELRIAIDTLVVENNSLQLTLANLRERCFDPLSKLGVAVQWDMQALHRSLPLSATQALSVFRILQEATTNALKHGAPQRIVVRGWCDGPRVTIEIRNEGGVALGAIDVGHGLLNMQRRAARLPQGEVALQSIDTGAVFSLSFECEAAE